MPLSVGTRLGPYEILAPIGAGGMGEVYRGRDTRLHREVAIKVSAEQFTERFEREARAVAALNHPNVCTLYDVGPNYLVMEYVDGAAPKGPYPLEEALRIAAQIRDALEHAHDNNIVHRDLKPGNIKVKLDGTVKVLDFGLAKVGNTPAAPAENSPTLSMAATQAGVILGTAGYMSPEQARGKTVDKRADIWAFGVVLWEMLTGKPLFEGEDVGHTLAAVIMKEPDLSVVPAKVRRLLARCLEKDPKKRLRDIGDTWQLLEDVPVESGSVRHDGGRVRLLKWIAAGALILAAAAIFVAWRAARPAERPLKPLVRLDVDLGPDVALSPGLNTILSPDGTRLVYVSQNRLFTRRLDQAKAVELVGTQGATSPFFSPDGEWVAFFSLGKLKKISVEGGSPIVLCNATSSFTGGSWGQDGNIIAALNAAGPLMRVSASGGTPEPVTELDRTRKEVTHRWPQILPGGRAVLFMAHTETGAFDESNIEVMSFADRHRKTLVRGGAYPRYLPTGHLLYVSRSALFAVPFDLDRMELRGTPVPVLDQVEYAAQFGFAELDFSASGTLVYRSGEDAGLVTVQWLDGAGNTQPLLSKPGGYLYPKLSPDGSRLAVWMDGDVRVYDPQRDTMTRLTFGIGSSTSHPLWTPDGRFILFGSAGNGMYWTRADGAGKPEFLTRSQFPQFPWSLTTDGKRLAYYELQPETRTDLWTVPLEITTSGLRAGKPEVFLQSPFIEVFPSISPDGRWLAYSSDEAGLFEVYVRAFPDRGGKWQVSSGGGMLPEWSRDGRNLFFQTQDGQVMIAAYSGRGDSFVAEKPRPWSAKRLANRGATRTFDVAPDGKRIVALMPVGEQAQKVQNHVIFLENFFDELRRRVPVSGK